MLDRLLGALRSARIDAHCWANRSANRSSDLRCCVQLEPGHARRHPAPYSHGASQAITAVSVRPRSAQAPRSACAASGWPRGEQPGRGEHVVVVDHRARRARQLPAPRYVVPGDRPEHPLGDLGPALLRSTPPDPTSRSTSRRSLPLRSTTRPPGRRHLATAPRAGAARPRPPPRRSPRRRGARPRSPAGTPGRRVVRRGGRSRSASSTRPAARPSSTVGTALQRIPRSPSTVRLTGDGGDHLAGRARRPRGRRSTTECTSVVAPPTSTTTTSPAPGRSVVETAGEQLDGGRARRRASRRGPSR